MGWLCKTKRFLLLPFGDLGSYTRSTGQTPATAQAAALLSRSVCARAGPTAPTQLNEVVPSQAPAEVPTAASYPCQGLPQQQRQKPRAVSSSTSGRTDTQQYERSATELRRTRTNLLIGKEQNESNDPKPEGLRTGFSLPTALEHFCWTFSTFSKKCF